MKQSLFFISFILIAGINSFANNLDSVKLVMQSGHLGAINALAFSPDSQELISGGEDGNIIIWDLQTGIQRLKVNSELQRIDKVYFSEDGSTLLAKNTSGKVAAWNYPNMNSTKSFSDPVGILGLNSKSKVSLVKEGVKYSMEIEGTRLKWQNETDEKSFVKFAPTKKSNYTALNGSGDLFAVADYQNIICLYSYDGTELNSLKGHDSKVNAIVFNDNSTILASAGGDNDILLWDTQTGKLIKELKGASTEIDLLKFSDDGRSIVIAYADASFRFWDLSGSNTIVDQKISPTVTQELQGWKYKIAEIANISESQVILKLSYFKTKDGSSTREREKHYELNWDLNNNSYSIIATGFQSYLSANNRNVKNPVYDFYATIGEKGVVEFVREIDSEPFIKLIGNENKEFVYVTDSNYYYASKNALDIVGFELNDEVHSFEQYDLIFNRPDKVLDLLNICDKSLVNAYEEAYFKRLSKQGVNLDELKNSKAPEIEVRFPNDLAVESKEILLHIGAKSAEQLEKLYVKVNGVNVLSLEEMVLNNKSISKELSVKLSPGINKVQIHVANSSGATSKVVTSYIKCIAKFEEPDLYVVSIGSGEFQQSDYNLKYASKDAQDILESLKKLKGYQEKKELLLQNNEVTRESLTRVSSFLKDARMNDLVILFIAGHGVLDKNLDYYLSTYYMDFNKPEEKGIPYFELQSILDHLDVRNKVLFMDACHSGEVDKEEVALITSDVHEAEDVMFRSVGNSVANKNNIGLKNSFEMSKDLFADMRESSGVIVISSAGAGEFAMEGDKWSNGVFTYALLEGLTKFNADLNLDKRVSISELQEYVYLKVSSLTNGKQTPTSRVENLDNDFIIKQ